MRERRSPTLPERVHAAEAAVAQFAGKSFAWGERDCVRLVAHALRELGVAPPLRQAGAYKTALGARRALKRTGHATLDGWVDAWGLQRIAPAFALPCDVLALPSGDPTMPALGLALSGARILAFVPEADGAAVFSLVGGVHPLAAWSV